jgi:hypothetical protein
MELLTMILYGGLGFVFTLAGVGKLINAPPTIQQFERLRLPNWFRRVIGWVELVGGMGTFIGIGQPEVGAIAGLWLAAILSGTLSVYFIHAKGPFGPDVILSAVLLGGAFMVAALDGPALMLALSFI